MRIKKLPLKKGQKLKQALDNAGYDNIPSNVVLDKILPGLGATYTEITAHRHSVIIEPNLPVIKGKELKHSGIHPLGVYGGITRKMIIKYLSDNSIKYKKLITTPESYWKIQKAAQTADVNLHADYFCLFDECERLTQDSGFRKKITNPVKDFFQYDQKAFVSATPLDIRHRLIEEQNFTRLIIEPDFDYQKDITVIATTNVVQKLQETLIALKESPCICIFFNSTEGINSIINSSSTIRNDYKVFCSEKSMKKMVKNEFKNVECELSLPLAKYNFFTSRFFSALDIELSVKPDIIIYTDLKQAEHTMIDPFSEAIQIHGRFRNVFKDGKTYNSFTHIANTKASMEIKTTDEIDKDIEFYREHYEYLNNIQKEANAKLSKTIESEKHKIKFSELLDDDGIIDEFAVNNLYYEERVKGYYKSAISLREAYSSNPKMFNLDFQIDTKLYWNELRFKIKKAKSRKQKIMEFVQLLVQFDSELVRKFITTEFDEGNIIIKAFDKLGVEYIESVDFDFKKIKKELDTKLIDEHRFCPAILEEIKNTFHVGEKQSKDSFKYKLQEIYLKHLINYKTTQTTIIEYFDASPDNSLTPAAYVLRKWNPLLHKDKRN